MEGKGNRELKQRQKREHWVLRRRAAGKLLRSCGPEQVRSDGVRIAAPDGHHLTVFLTTSPLYLSIRDHFFFPSSFLVFLFLLVSGVGRGGSVRGGAPSDSAPWRHPSPGHTSPVWRRSPPEGMDAAARKSNVCPTLTISRYKTTFIGLRAILIKGISWMRNAAATPSGIDGRSSGCFPFSLSLETFNGRPSFSSSPNTKLYRTVIILNSTRLLPGHKAHFFHYPVKLHRFCGVVNWDSLSLRLYRFFSSLSPPPVTQPFVVYERL